MSASALRGQRALVLVLALILLVDVVWLALAGWTVGARGLLITGTASALLLAPLSLRRYRSDPRLRTTLTMAALLLVFEAAGSILSYLVVSTNAPLVDATLAAWDRALGFDWVAWRNWCASHPRVEALFEAAYSSGLPQLAVVVLYLGLTARHAELERFMRLLIGATLVSIAVSGLAPAAGAGKYFAAAGSFDVSFLTHFEAVREGQQREVHLSAMQGLISIPSLHAAMAVLMAFAMRHTRLASVFLVLNVLMLAATPSHGSHFLIDVIAGIALAVALVALDRRGRAAGETS